MTVFTFHRLQIQPRNVPTPQSLPLTFCLQLLPYCTYLLITLPLYHDRYHRRIH